MAARVIQYLPGEHQEAVLATMRLIADMGFGILGFAAMRGGGVGVARIADELAAAALATIQGHHPNANRAG